MLSKERVPMLHISLYAGRILKNALLVYRVTMTVGGVNLTLSVEVGITSVTLYG